MSKNAKAASGQDAALYARGKYWLGEADYDSSNYCVFHYDTEKRKVVRASTRTSDLEKAKLVLDETYLNDTTQHVAFCPTCGQKIADGESYGIHQAYADYKLEHAVHKPQYVSIRAKLDLMMRYFEIQYPDDEDIACKLVADDQFATRFRDWALQQKRQSATGPSNGTYMPATVEGSLRYHRAAILHAVKKGRTDARINFSLKSAAKVSKRVTANVTVEDMAQMVKYSLASPKRHALWRFLIASLATGARPDAIYDINTNPDRDQWQKDRDTLDLNPFNRDQTSKFRPMLPILPPMKMLLETASPDGWVIHYHGKRVKAVRTGWRAMMEDLGHTTNMGERQKRDWGAYVIRRSLYTILLNHGVNYDQVRGWFGHVASGVGNFYSAGQIYPQVQAALVSIHTDIEVNLGHSLIDFAPGLHPGPIEVEFGVSKKVGSFQ